MVMVDRDLEPHLAAGSRTEKADPDVGSALLGLQVEATLSTARFNNQPYNASAMSFYRWF